MEVFLSKILETLKKLNIKTIIYGSFGVSVYLGNFKNFKISGSGILSGISGE